MTSQRPEVGDVWAKRKGKKAQYEVVEVYQQEFVCAVNRQPGGVCYAWQGSMTDFLRDFEFVRAKEAV